MGGTGWLEGWLVAGAAGANGIKKKNTLSHEKVFETVGKCRDNFATTVVTK